MTVTFQISRDIGWEYLKKLGQQQVIQVQSAADPPKKVAQGERPLMADGGEYLPLQMIATGAPLAIVYPAEGTPLNPRRRRRRRRCAASQRGPAVRALPVLARWPAAVVRYGAHSLLPPRRQAPGRHEAALRDQDHEGRSQRPGKSGRRDQEEIR